MRAIAISHSYTGYSSHVKECKVERCRPSKLLLKKANHGYHRSGGKREGEESEMEKQEALRSQIVAQYTELASNHLKKKT